MPATSALMQLSKVTSHSNERWDLKLKHTREVQFYYYQFVQMSRVFNPSDEPARGNGDKAFRVATPLVPVMEAPKEKRAMSGLSYPHNQVARGFVSAYDSEG
eukprot:TRINITY_DN830_c0_g1_i2.p2 TRINITY_DN830_c0_g1~~TRINITY_DN830_c0_g1_i2.p2  ORF type:complete len:102 (+),score=5.85 TRINITY_DN830_c0_g1_i2:250-555(+)